MAIPWVLVSAITVAIILVVLAVWAVKYGKGKIKPWTADQWIEGGAILLLVAYIACRFGRDVFVVGFLGIIYLAVGLIRKHLLKSKKK